MFGRKNRRRKRLAALPFPAAWEEILRAQVPLYRRLPAADRRELRGHIQVFLSEKRFEGCAGLAITDEIRVTIAGHACLLLLRRPTDYYPRLVTVLVYPHPFVVDHETPGPAGMILASRRTLLGQSWRHGVVILAWDAIEHKAMAVEDGHNVAFHEFAHQLDEEDGSANGVPVIASPSLYRAWARVLGRDYEQLVRDAESGLPSVLDAYGATHPAEFFAVATESFFESPLRLRARHGELYDVLKQYYRLDPAALLDRAAPGD